jgi:integrase
MQTGRVAGGLVISRRGGGVETADAISDRAESAWKSARLDPLTMHEARHTYASLMILAGVPITALARFMGHTSITTTVDRYGHLYPSERRTAAAALDALLADLG